MTERLIITEYDDVLLPYDFHFSHNNAVRLYDDLVWLLKDAKTQRKLTSTVKFGKDEVKPNFDEVNIFDWLIQSGRQNQADEIISKHLLFAIISDICHFIFQALNSSKKIKITVAFSLIRKPFLENLLIIEQLLADEKNFLVKFEKNPEEFDPGKINDKQKRELISKCLEKVKPNFTLDEESIFELRFDKKNPNSFYAMSNLATHLVTTRHSEFRTESGNMNFIFSSYEEWGSQLAYFYYFVPYMLLYTTEIVDQYLKSKKIIDVKTFKNRKFKRFVMQLLQFDQFDEKSAKGKSLINKMSKFMKVKCENCNKINSIFKSDLFSLIHNDYILCKHCLIDLYYESDSFEEARNTLIKNFDTSG